MEFSNRPRPSASTSPIHSKFDSFCQRRIIVGDIYYCFFELEKNAHPNNGHLILKICARNACRTICFCFFFFLFRWDWTFCPKLHSVHVRPSRRFHPKSKINTSDKNSGGKNAFVIVCVFRESAFAYSPKLPEAQKFTDGAQPVYAVFYVTQSKCDHFKRLMCKYTGISSTSPLLASPPRQMKSKTWCCCRK